MTIRRAVALQSSREDPPLISKDDVVIPVMGMTGTGKSTFISLCTQEPKVEIGHDLSSCTSRVTIQSMRHCGRVIHLIDTPGFDDSGRSDRETLQEIAFWLTVAYENDISISGIIYLHRITDLRVQGAGLQSLNVFKRLCGTENYHGVVMGTTRWDELAPNQRTKARARHQELKDRFWGDIMQAGGDVVALQTPQDDALRIITDIANKDCKLTLAFQRQLVDQKRQLFQTDAGRIVYEGISEQMDMDEARLEDTKSSIKDELAWLNSREQKELEKMRKQIVRTIQASKEDISELRIGAEALQESWMKRMDCDFEDMRQRLTYNSIRESSELNSHPLAPSSIGERSTNSLASVVRSIPSVIEEDTPSRIEGTYVARKERPGKRLAALTVIGTALGGAQLIAAMACTVM